VANNENLVSLADRTTEEKREIAVKGGKASGKVRQEKKTMRETLRLMLEEIPKDNNPYGLSYKQLATLGLIKGSIEGNNANYKTIMETIGEIETELSTTPTLKIEITDNSKLEGVMYEANQSIQNDDK
jgi:hypothetical protein